MKQRQPVPPEATEALCAAYLDLAEKEKRRITRFLFDHEPDMAQHARAHGRFPKGALPRRIADREGQYGKAFDRFVCAPEPERETFLWDLAHRFAVHDNLLEGLLREAIVARPAAASLDELADQVTEMDHPFSRLVALVIKHRSPPGAWPGAATYRGSVPTAESSATAPSSVARADDSASGPDADGPGPSGPPVPVAAEGPVTHAPAEAAASQGALPLTTGLPESPAADIARLESLHEALAVSAEQFEAWAGDLRRVNPPDWDAMAVVVGTAREDMAAFRELLNDLCSQADLTLESFGSPADVEAGLAGLAAVLTEKDTRTRIAQFLRGLAQALAELVIEHRSGRSEARLRGIRDEAVAEVKQVAGSANPGWIEPQPLRPREWLESAFCLTRPQFEQLEKRLGEAAFPRLAELVAEGQLDWFPTRAVGAEREVPPETAGPEAAPGRAAMSADTAPAEVPPPATPTTAGLCTTPPATPPEPPSCVSTCNRAVALPEPGAVSAALSPTTEATDRVLEPLQAPSVEPAPGTTTEAPSVEPVPGTTAEAPPPMNGPRKGNQETSAHPPCTAAHTPVSGGVAPENMLRDWPDEGMGLIAAAYLRESGAPEQAYHLRRLIWKCLAEGELGFAYHLTCDMESRLAGEPFILPSWVPEALLLGPALVPDDYELQQELLGLFSRFDADALFREDTRDWNLALRLVLAAAALRPAVLGPVTGAGTVLAGLHLGHTPVLHEIVQAVVEFSGLGITLGPDLLRATMSTAEWDRRCQELIKEVARWRQNARTRTTNFQKATQVWLMWLRQGGFVESLLSGIGKDDEKSIEVLRQRLANTKLEQQIDCSTRDILGKTTHLEGPARRQLHRYAEEAFGLARTWVSLVESDPHREGGFGREHVGALRKAITDRESAAIAELRGLGADGQGRFCPCGVGARLLERALSDVGQLLCAVHPMEPAVPPVALPWVRRQDLLRVPGLKIGADPNTAVSPEVGAAIVSAIAAGQAGWDGAFERHLSEGNHQATAHILDVLRARGDAQQCIGELEARRERSIKALMVQLQDQLRQLQQRLGDALAKGLVGSQEYNERAALIQQHEKDLLAGRLEEHGRFCDVLDELQETRARLDAEQEQTVVHVRERLARVSKGLAAERGRIESILDGGDVYLANDYLDRLEDGQSLPSEVDGPAASELEAFLGIDKGALDLKVFSALEQYLANPAGGYAGLIKDVEYGTPIAGMRITDVPQNRRMAHANVMRRWFELHKTRSMEKGHIREILNGLGFEVKGIQDIGERRGVLEVQTGIAQGPVPAPQFGSQANGRFALFCVFRSIGPEDILSIVEPGLPAHPGCIALYFGRLTLKERRAMAHACGRRSRSLIVIDDVLVTYLASVGEGKLRALLECCLPFSWLMPYSSTAGLLAPEMFFGRKREAQALESMGGGSSCFVFGGRQIGKTVLLKHVQRHCRRPSSGQLAQCLDLKQHGIGLNRGIDELWSLIVEQLGTEAPDLFTGSSRPRQVGPDWFSAAVRTWLKGDTGRRILLLLDEADSFLESDSRGEGKPPFSRCDVLRGLMQETQQRFKVVFAGLHNVQRSTRVENNPLAHFGRPICVGPLLENGEAREAHRLIVEPLACLGVFFTSTDLPNRILAQTNYYPNLIQIYCQNLLDHITHRRGFIESADTPPYFVTPGDIDEVYERKELRAELQDKFRLTLDLDRRFSLLAHLLAYEEIEYPDGMTVEQLRQEALYWWASGFQESSDDKRPIAHDRFRNLLDEMEGLGILRRTRDQLRYGLRSPNVSALLGPRPHVEAVLMSAQSWEPPAQYDAETFRSVVGESSWRRSPFTAAQEGVLNGPDSNVMMVIGVQASGLDEVPDALRHVFGTEYVQVLQSVADLKAFEAELARLRKRKGTGKTLVFVPDTAEWTVDWLEQARERVGRLYSREAPVSVLFACGPARLWRLLEDGADLGQLTSARLQLTVWQDQALRRWFEDSEVGSQTAEVRGQVRAVTGNWHGLLGRLADELRNQAHLGDALGQVRSYVIDPARRGELRQAFGVDGEPVLRVMRMVADYGPMSAEEIWQEAGDLTPQVVERFLRWAELLGVASSGRDGWTVNSTVSPVVQSATGN